MPAGFQSMVGREMFLPESFDSTVFVNGEAVIPMGSMDTPGFLACQYEFTSPDGKRSADLVKLGFEPERIESFTAMPSDFEAF